MKIAYICADFGVPVFGFKGASIHLREMTGAFRRAGHTVMVFSPAMHKGKADEKKSNMGEQILAGNTEAVKEVKSEIPDEFNQQGSGEVRYFSVLPKKSHAQFTKELKELDKFFGEKSRIRQEIRNLLYNLAMKDALNGVLTRERPDFIYERYTLFSFAGIRIARKLGVPHILEVNAPLAYEQEKMRGLELKSYASKLEKKIWQDTDRVVAVSEELKTIIEKSGVAKSSVEVIPNSVNPQRFTNPEGAASLSENLNLSDRIIIGFIGSLKSWHGTDTLLEGFRQLSLQIPKAHLLIVGDGPERETLENFVRKNDLENRVTFTGKVSHDDIPKYIAIMDITVAPYIPHDSFYFSPIKIFEYMASGKPVIAGRIGQVATIIKQEKNGILFEPGNIPRLTAELKKLCENPALGKALGQNARTWVLKERTWDKNAERILQILQELIRE